jgi:hypothetical protein
VIWLSKYPPAEPGALGCEPLEAAVGAADAAPDRVGHLKVAHQRHSFICSRRLPSSSCFLMYSRITSVSRPQHVHVIQQKITFLDLAFLLLSCRRSSKYKVFLRHFGIKTTWYLHSHLLCKLS